MGSIIMVKERLAVKIKLVTDSTADISQEVLAQYGIEMVPLKVHFGEEEFLDSVTIQSQEFYEKLTQSNVLPTTSQPSPVEFLEVYKKLIAEDPDVSIISIHISANLSGTYQSAVLAKSLLEDESANITLIDSKSASYGIGMLVIAAAKAIEQGKSLEEVVEEVYDIRNKMGLYFVVDTLEYLQKGGRIGKAASVLGSLLNVKPILSLDHEGEVYSVDRVRGQKKALGRMVELFQQDFRQDQPLRMILAHSNAPDFAEEVGALMKQHFAVDEVIYTTLSPVIGTHTGPGTIGVFMCPL